MSDTPNPSDQPVDRIGRLQYVSNNGSPESQNLDDHQFEWEYNQMNAQELLHAGYEFDEEFENFDDEEEENEEVVQPVVEQPEPRPVRPRGIGNDGIRVVGGDPDRVVVPPIFEQPTQYDQNLTPAHKYLGVGLQETTGRTIYEEGVVHSLPVIFLQLNLMPGQILPIIARATNIKSILRYALTKDRTFGVSFKYNKKKRTFGTVAQIFEHSASIETIQSFQVKAMGHQRFEILSITPFFQCSDSTIAMAQVKILRDITLFHPYKNLCLNPKNNNLKHSTIYRKKDMWQTQWPDWVYKQFDPHHLATRITEKVKMLYKDIKISDDPALLSLQITRLGVFTSDQVTFLLGLESTNLRLQYELQFWNKRQSMQKFFCSNCGIPVCDMSNVITMSPEGPQGTYCNSWGQIHEMITVTELDDDMEITTIGAPSAEFSWFPGYRWIIILCQQCQNHLGWRFLAVDSNSLVPRVFYGLSMRSITSIRDYLIPDQNREPYEEVDMDETLVAF